VEVLGDQIVEPNETFVVNLSAAVNATVADGQGEATIVNDDTIQPVAEGRMFGAGRLVEGSTRYHFVFRITERNDRQYGRFEFWSVDRWSGKDVDDNGDGTRDTDYGRRRFNLRSIFESTSIASVQFGDDPAFTPDRGRRQPAADSVVFSGTGKWNGARGYTFEVRATDQGDGGRGRDTFSVVVKDSAGVVVSSVDGAIDGGNIESTRLHR